MDLLFLVGGVLGSGVFFLVFQHLQDRRLERVVELISQTIDKTATQVAYPGGGPVNSIPSTAEIAYADLTWEDDGTQAGSTP